MTDYTVPFRPMPAQPAPTPEPAPALHVSQMQFALAAMSMRDRINAAPTFAEAMKLWKDCRNLEQALEQLSAYAAAKCESFIKE